MKPTRSKFDHGQNIITQVEDRLRDMERMMGDIDGKATSSIEQINTL